MISWWHVAFSTSQDIDLFKQRYAAPLSGEYKLIIVNKLYTRDRVRGWYIAPHGATMKSLNLIPDGGHKIH